MSNKTFFASQWLNKDIESLEDSAVIAIDQEVPEVFHVKGRFPTFIPGPRVSRSPEVSDRFSPLHCFVPGWKGDSLLSKNVIKFERILTLVQMDVKNELFKTKDFPKTIKLGLYNEFLSYAETLGLHFEGLDDLGNFWQAISPEALQDNPKLLEFIDIYANRVATITFLKLRFISSLLDRCGIELTDKALLYPTSFLSQIFKKGSISELQSRALESNLYSWYRPHEGMKEAMKELLIVSRDLAITEITKHISLRTQVEQDQQKVYSHALSHVSLGLFLNSLQINFPLWLETIEGKKIPTGGMEDEEIVSCKYFGDYLESLSLSHWLAQENNKDFHWDQFLCPDFKGLEFISGTFTKICNELQFLTFLAYKAESQHEKPIDYICKIMGGHFRNRKNNQVKQGFLLEDNPFYTSTYDRVVLNLCHFPKNNPQHYLMTQIGDQVKYLKPNGYLFVLSSKKLFVPSLRERLEPVLRELKTEAIFDLENVKGKGELGSYIYVFRKKNKCETEKQLCSYFRISAELDSFHNFSSVTEHLRSFYLSHLNEVPPMAHLDFPDSFRVEFFQEAVVNGMLIHSTSEDSSRITHPAYFKGLLANCVPLDTIFEIKSLHSEEKFRPESTLNLGLKRDVSYFLVVDFRHGDVNLEIHPMDTFRSIHSDYGETLCSYFQLIPKIPGLNPNILRNYFLTTVGKQVMNLTFTGGLSLVKGSLSKFLVPKFLTETESLPEHLKSGFRMLEMNEEQLLDASPRDILQAFQHIDQITKNLFPRYACEILSRYSNLERTLQSLIWKMDDLRFGQKVSFSNPLVQGQLVQKPTRPLYPENEDIFLEFVEGTVPTDIHLPLTQTQLKVSHEGELKLYSLELMSHHKVIVRLHTEEPMVLFIQFLLSHAVDVPISKILRAVHIPSLSDLKEIIETTQSFKTSYQELLGQVQNSITHAMRVQVTPKRMP
ncbi:hypothetical protein ACJVC5_00405 [Peredibacter sp. HCB2-198]|uniref:hypothetical protein n=1 Tax=Peredibacter sp. HCB2-198 TaxID=3383025 RepID=UPI0038B4FF7E